ncbi:MAG: FHA domain-containing protein [Gemmatimonadales bacterium]|nr:FHA domain-containing protein [Gemmatimonadales bacterium]NIN09794.1 FHA domain-containing protein [Gemmatimonadales bacterium]NIN48776.1 FHA domain-containing protein [Gemmatimonadales bacterium]NIP06240.1 FHA domain-containing protein [Gemmatimonadales bacterium]NIR02661.1 FHA domain-containing protein [Gemmatimonadales bacterium]
MTAFKLLSTTGDQTIDLTHARTIVVGRAVTSDLPIYDPTVSRRHAEVSLIDSGVRVHDLGSSNGTFVNGTRITDSVAVDGDVVTFGKVAFKVLEVTPPKARPAVDTSGFAGRPPPPEATIVRQVAVEEPGALEDKVAARPSGASQLKVEGESVDERQAQKLSLLLDISKELSKQQDVNKLLEKVVDITFKVMNVDRVSILMLEGAEELVPRVSLNRLAEGSGARVPQSIARRAVDERLAILTDNAAADERFKGKSIVMQSVRSAMCTPLMGSEGNVLGIIYVDNMTATNSFGDEDLEFLIAFSGIAAVAIENSRLTEQVQREAVVLSNFQRYFAPDLAEEIASQAEAVQLGGTKRPVVVFFSDIRDFTPMSENMMPDEIATLLTEYFTEMVEVVFENGGTLDKFMGDAIMALWGAPITHADDADRAMRAAIAQQETLAQMNEKWAEQGRQQVQIGIGINFGEVFAGNIGSDRRLEYTVIGDAVNTASRLCSQAGPGEILISEPFYQALKQPPEVEALEPIQLKGKAQAVPIYRVKR